MADPIPARKAPMASRSRPASATSGAPAGAARRSPSANGTHKEFGLKPVAFVAEKTEQAWLCGCKASGNKPFCDGTPHSKI